jgi:hypothetical protein
MGESLMRLKEDSHPNLLVINNARGKAPKAGTISAWGEAPGIKTASNYCERAESPIHRIIWIM